MRLPTDAPREYIEGDCTNLEARADVASMEGLQHERRVLVAQMAPLKALHRSSGKWDAKRKALLSVMKIRARLQPMDGIKVTDASVDDMGHADPQYMELIDQGIADETAYIVMQNDVDALTERIRSREVELNSYNAELRLSK